MPEGQNPIRIAFVGVGGMGQCAHLRNFASLEGCRVIAIAEVRKETAMKVASRYQIPAVYTDLHEMITKEEPDAIVCSQPFQRHAVLLPELLPYRIPLFIEKPLAGSFEAGAALQAKIAEAAVPVMVGYHKRSDPATMYAYKHIQQLKSSQELGAIRYVRITMPPGDWIANGFWDYLDAGEPRPSFAIESPPTDMDSEGYQLYLAFVNYYIHQINLLRHLFGEPYDVEFADPNGILLVARSKTGITGVIEMSPYQTTLDWQESALITFERGYIRINLPAPIAVNRPGTVEIFQDPGNGTIPMAISPQLPWIHAMRQQAINFLDAVRGYQPYRCDTSEALEDLRIARQYLRLWKNI